MANVSSKTATRKSTYDPGTPAGARHLGNGLCEVQSFREAGKPNAPATTYLADVPTGECSCPQHEYRIAPARERGETVPSCKHVTFAERYLACLEYVERHTMAEPIEANVVWSDAPMARVIDADTYDADPFARPVAR